MCPVCSKLYKEIEKNHNHQQQNPSPVRREHFVTAPSVMVNNCSKLKTAVIVLGALLFIIFLLWWKSKYVGSKVVPISAYMNRR